MMLWYYPGNSRKLRLIETTFLATPGVTMIRPLCHYFCVGASILVTKRLGQYRAGLSIFSGPESVCIGAKPVTAKQ